MRSSLQRPRCRRWPPGGHICDPTPDQIKRQKGDVVECRCRQEWTSSLRGEVKVRYGSSGGALSLSQVQRNLESRLPGVSLAQNVKDHCTVVSLCLTARSHPVWKSHQNWSRSRGRNERRLQQKFPSTYLNCTWAPWHLRESARCAEISPTHVSYCSSPLGLCTMFSHIAGTH